MANDVSYFFLWTCHLHILFGEMSVHIFCPFSNWIFLNCSVLRVLIYSKYKLSIEYVVCKQFLPICSLSFHLLDGIYCKTESYILMRSDLSIFPFIDLAFDVKFKSSLPNPRFRGFSPVFLTSSYSFTFYRFILLWDLGQGMWFYFYWRFGVFCFVFCLMSVLLLL